MSTIEITKVKTVGDLAKAISWIPEDTPITGFWSTYDGTEDVVTACYLYVGVGRDELFVIPSAPGALGHLECEYGMIFNTDDEVRR